MLSIESKVPKFNVYPNPNPNDGVFSISYDIETNANLEIFDSQGKRIYSKQLVDGKHVIQVDLEFDSGVYYVKVTNFKGDYSYRKVIVTN